MEDAGSSPVVLCAHRAQPPTLTPGASMPCGAHRVPEQGSSSLCPSSSGVVINDNVDILPAWRCGSCRQTTLVDGVVPRSARRGFGEPHFSVKL